jgi:hypothetical protein
MINNFTRKYIDDDGTVHIWEYDLDKFKFGPVNVNIDYKNTTSSNNLITLKTEKKYLNPHNGKYVGYQRAKQLGII